MLICDFKLSKGSYGLYVRLRMLHQQCVSTYMYVHNKFFRNIMLEIILFFFDGGIFKVDKFNSCLLLRPENEC